MNKVVSFIAALVLIINLMGCVNDPDVPEDEPCDVHCNPIDIPTVPPQDDPEDIIPI